MKRSYNKQTTRMAKSVKGSKNTSKTTTSKKSSTKSGASNKKAVKTVGRKTKTSQSKKAVEKNNTSPIRKILVSQPKPSSDKSPYFDLARKHNLELTFHQFINVEGVSGKDFKKSGLNINDYNGIILLSRNAVDHFFRVCDEVKYKVPQNLRYFCASEAIALYLQKFILYRKRKVAFSPDGSTEGLLEVIMKFKDECTLMLPVSERTKNEIAPLMKANDINFQEAALYRIAGNDLTKFNATDYDAILLFSPFGVDVVMDDMKEIASKKIRVATYGTSTAEAAKVAGLNIMLEAPTPLAPSMITAIDLYIKKNFPQ